MRNEHRFASLEGRGREYLTDDDYPVDDVFDALADVAHGSSDDAFHDGWAQVMPRRPIIPSLGAEMPTPP